MQGYLYKITNTINNKSYIGKTYKSVDYRFKAHYRDSKRFPNRPLYRAFNKYGFDKFIIETLGEYPDTILEVEEAAAIAKFDTFNNGYNATLGGDGKRYRVFDELYIVELYKSGRTLRSIAKELNTCKNTISSILKTNDITVSSGNYKKKIFIKDLDLIFISVSDCAEYLINKGIAKSSHKSTCIGIYRALSGARKSYLKLEFSFIES